MGEWSESDLRYEGWRVTAASSASLFFACFTIYTFAVFFAPLAAEFSWTREIVSSAYGAMAVSAALTAPLIGYVLDRVPVRRIVGPAMALVGLGFVSLSLLRDSVPQFLGTFVLFGAAGTCLSPLAYSRAIATWFQRRRGLALGIVIGGAAVAAMVQPPLMQLAIDRIGWRSSYLVIGLAMLLVGTPLASALIRSRPSDSESGTVLRVGASFAGGIQTRVFWTIAAVFFASSIAMNGAIVHLSALLTDRGVSPAHAALAISTMGAASLAGRLSTGWLLDRFFGPRISFILLSVAALGTWLLAAADSLFSGAAAAALIGFGMGGELDVIPYLLSRYFGLKALSTLYGVAYGASAVAGAIGPVILGRAFDSTGSYDVLLPRIALFMLLMSLLMLTLPQYRRPSGSDAGAAEDSAILAESGH